MNRNEEFYSYKAELETSLPELSAANSIKRAKKYRKHSLIWKAPSFSLLTTAALFILLVNLFPKVALAMSKIPFLEDLVAAVAFDPGLRLAVENDYVQVVGARQTKDNVTVSVDYMILDAGHISLFFKIDAPVASGEYHYDFLDENGEGLPAAIVFDSMYESGSLEKIDLEFLNGGEIPKEFQVKLTVDVDPNFKETQTATYDPSTGEYIEAPPSQTCKSYEFLFHLYPDETFRKAIVSLPIRQWLELKEQRIYLDRLNIYPTQARLYLEVDPANSALLKGLDISFADENGNSYNPKMGGATGTLDTDGLNIDSIFFESSYFSESEHLRLIINGVSLLDKDKLYGIVQYDTKSITNLPEGVSVSKMELRNSSLILALQADWNNGQNASSFFDSQYYDIDGNEYFFHTYSFDTNEEKRRIRTQHTIKDFKDHYYKLRWSYAPLQVLEEPIEVKIK